MEKGNEATRQNELKWKNQTINDIKLNNSAIEKSDKNIFFGKHDDPLTNLREVLRTLSNKEAFKYMRQCRLVVAKLKKCWVDVNEEVKSLSKNKEYLESAIEHVRKDLIINQETMDGRIHKPSREPVNFHFLHTFNTKKKHSTGQFFFLFDLIYLLYNTHRIKIVSMIRSKSKNKICMSSREVWNKF